MSILFFLVFLLVMIALTIIARYFWGKDALFVVGIGCVIGANIYNSTTFPIELGVLTFGFDSVLYTVFSFCMIVMYIDYGRSSFNTLLYSSISSILLSSFFLFVANLSSFGFSVGLLLSFLSYIFSIIGTFAAIWVMRCVFDALQKRNVNIYVNLLVCLFLASLINSLIYFGLTFVVQLNLGDEFWFSLLGSYVGKFVTIGFCLFAYFLNQVLQKRRQDNLSKLDNL